MRDTLTVGLVSIFFIRGRVLQLSLELMRFDKTFLHLLLEVLKSGTLPHIYLLVSGLHLAWTKLFDGLGMLVRILESMIDFVDVSFCSKSGGTLDSH